MQQYNLKHLPPILRMLILAATIIHKAREKITRTGLAVGLGISLVLGLGLSLLVFANTKPANSVPADDLLVHNAKITTFDGKQYTGFAVSKNKFTELFRRESDISPQRKAAAKQIINAEGRRVIPGINDSHLHVVRGGRFYNLETHWEGIRSLKQGLKLIADQAKRTPKGQWVRVVGGFSPYQFEEKRMPTPEELTAAAPDTPVFVLLLYSGGVLNKAGMTALGIDANSKAPKGSRFERNAKGEPTGVLVADPNPAILYGTIAQLPHMTAEQQLNSSRHFYQKMLSLGVTSVVDAGGGGHEFPLNYQASSQMAISGELPIRVNNYLFPQRRGQEFEQFASWMTNYKQNQNLHGHAHQAYVIEGGGELLVWSASDYENFTSSRPELAKTAEAELEKVIRLHLIAGWPFRIHATYNETISRMLNVLEKVNKTQALKRVRWAFDHVETITDANLKRVKQLGGGIAIQGRMAFAGEYFLERYGEAQTRRSPPMRKILDMGIPLGMGTDGTRVSSFNPWWTYYWAVSGRTVGGTKLYDKNNRLDRLTALQLFTQGSAWFSHDEDVKGQIAPGMLADFAILDRDILRVKDEQLLDTQALVTVMGGKIRFASQGYAELAPDKIPRAIPEWSPVNLYK